ncbi:MAG: FtsX-like permease family protein [Acidobacteria bacterium]|nr:MAG: FtsX-like permease family protein [Acidobacteriota bacterium]
MISRSLARALWDADDVIGRTITSKHSPFRDDADYTVVGVIDEIQLRSITPMPALLTARRDELLPIVLGAPAIEPEVKTMLSTVDPDFRVRAVPLADGLRRQMQATYLAVSIASGLGLVALLLASVGVFGVFAYIVEERRREIGVRLALGATCAQVGRSVVAITRWPVIGGLSVGLGLAIVGGFLLRGNLYGLSILDPVSYLAVAAALGTAAILATFIPLRRAMRVDPAVALRAD